MSDLINREDALRISVTEGYDRDGIIFIPMRDVTRHLRGLPPAQPQRMHGRWINLDDVERDLGATCFAKRTDDGELIALCSLDVYADMREESNESND